MSEYIPPYWDQNAWKTDIKILARLKLVTMEIKDQKQRQIARTRIIVDWIKQQQDAAINLEHEEWKTVVIEETELPQYKVSNFGRIVDEQGNILSRCVQLPKANGRGANDSKSLYLKPNQLHLVRSDIQKRHLKCRRVRIHKLVANAFLPFELNPPVDIDIWNRTPPESQAFMKSCAILDHIDDNPFNNHVSNLRWTTPLGNSVAIKDTMIRNGALSVTNKIVLRGTKIFELNQESQGLFAFMESQDGN